MEHFISDIPLICSHMYHLHEDSSNRHRDCRFITILRGKIILTLNNRKYLLEKDNTLYIPCDQTYHVEVLNAAILLCVCFHPLFLLETIGFDYKYIVYNSSAEHIDTARAFNQQIASLAAISLQQAEPNKLLVRARAYSLLDSISRTCIVVPDSDLLLGEKQHAKLLQLQHYISNNYQHSLSLSETAGILDYTPQYLSNFIKKNLHITFADYVNQIRSEAAILYLKYTEEPPVRIAGLCGFSNITMFEKTFLDIHHMKLTEYIRSLSTQPLDDKLIEVTDFSLSLNYLYTYMNYTENVSTFSNSAKIRKVSVNGTRTSELDSNWNVLINVGKASDFIRPSFRQHLTRMQQDIFFHYGRFTECMSLSVIHNSKEGVTYDFSKIFDVTDFLLSIHLKPFIDIDNKPFDIYRVDPEAWNDYRTFADVEHYDSFLLEILPPFLNACVSRYGFDELCTWKFELWRRYNPDQTSLEPAAKYVSRFQEIASIFKNVDSNLCLGGPGFNSFQDSSNFAQILSGFQGKEYCPDFISAYFFPFVHSTPSPAPHSVSYRVTSSVNDMAMKISELNHIIAQYHFENRPFYITEYTSYMLSNNYINDSSYPATYILSQSIENYGKVNGLGYWLASDASLDHKISASPFFGGNGLFSRDGICKPSYYAFSLLKGLGQYLVSQGDNYIVTATEDGHIQVLIYYHSSIIEQHSVTDPQGENLLYYPHSAFEEQLPLDFQIDLKQLHPGHYNVKEISLDLNHGNVLNIWGEFDFINNIRPEDILYMRQLSRPSIHIRLEEVEDYITLHTTLNPNEAKLFELELYYQKGDSYVYPRSAIYKNKQQNDTYNQY
ncbi:MAG: helix-turn-helix domain-containing protein [Hespellia sp.]|nr:helix-turn-helix domain-containing protein [Hespellia sp.]